jgi:hypothetical protein
MLVGPSVLVRAGVVGLGVTALVAGCGLSGIKKSIDRINASASAYGELQSPGSLFVARNLAPAVRRLAAPTTRFRSLVLGGQLVMITPGGTRGLDATVSG